MTGGTAATGVDNLLEMVPKAERVQRTADGRWMIQAPAKLNLGLRVYPARPDGFHDLETWMVPISWHDTLWVEPDKPLELVISGRREGIPTEVDKNLVGRAAISLAREGGIEARGRIELQKVVPPGGGMGGGSSDAANVLVLLNEVWKLGCDAERLMTLAAELGSDVPFFVRGRGALCTGRGEVMRPLRSRGSMYAVLIVPGQGLATKPVYQAFDAGHRAEDGEAIQWCRWAALSATELNEELVNDLEPAAFAIAPWLAQLREQAASILGQKVHMTGSGSTLFTLCSSGPQAAKIGSRLETEMHGPVSCVPVRILRQI